MFISQVGYIAMRFAAPWRWLRFANRGGRTRHTTYDMVVRDRYRWFGTSRNLFDAGPVTRHQFTLNWALRDARSWAVHPEGGVRT